MVGIGNKLCNSKDVTSGSCDQKGTGCQSCLGAVDGEDAFAGCGALYLGWLQENNDWKVVELSTMSLSSRRVVVEDVESSTYAIGSC